MFDSNGDLNQTSSRKLSRINQHCIHALIAAYFNLMSKLNGITAFSNHVDEVRSPHGSCRSLSWFALFPVLQRTTMNRFVLLYSDCSTSRSACRLFAAAQCFLFESQRHDIQSGSKGMFILSRNSRSCIECFWSRYISIRTRISSWTRFVVVLRIALKRSSRDSSYYYCYCEMWWHEICDVRDSGEHERFYTEESPRRDRDIFRWSTCTRSVCIRDRQRTCLSIGRRVVGSLIHRTSREYERGGSWAEWERSNEATFECFHSSSDKRDSRALGATVGQAASYSVRWIRWQWIDAEWKTRRSIDDDYRRRRSKHDRKSSRDEQFIDEWPVRLNPHPAEWAVKRQWTSAEYCVDRFWSPISFEWAERSWRE